jgi:hypothetical protein
VLLHTRERNSFSISPQTQSHQLPLIASDQLSPPGPDRPVGSLCIKLCVFSVDDVSVPTAKANRFALLIDLQDNIVFRVGNNARAPLPQSVRVNSDGAENVDPAGFVLRPFLDPNPDACSDRSRRHIHNSFGETQIAVPAFDQLLQPRQHGGFLDARIGNRQELRMLLQSTPNRVRGNHSRSSNHPVVWIRQLVDDWRRRTARLCPQMRWQHGRETDATQENDESPALVRAVISPFLTVVAS